MSDDHTRELKEFIFSHLREQGFAGTDKELDTLVFQTPSTLRLRKAGYFIMCRFYHHETFVLTEKLTGRELMTLKRNVGWPYWLPMDHNRLVLFAVRDSFFLKLQGGDVKKWLSQVYEKNS